MCELCGTERRVVIAESRRILMNAQTKVEVQATDDGVLVTSYGNKRDEEWKDAAKARLWFKFCPICGRKLGDYDESD